MNDFLTFENAKQRHADLIADNVKAANRAARRRTMRAAARHRMARALHRMANRLEPTRSLPVRFPEQRQTFG